MSALWVALQVLAVFTLIYFVCLNFIYAVFTVTAWRAVRRSIRARAYAPTYESLASPLSPGISVLVPAYNEEAGIVDSVRSLLALRYPKFEVVVVNDGSTDGTLGRLIAEFDLVEVHRAARHVIPSRPVRAVYASRRNRDLCVIDKENGGKADALNAGVDSATHPYVCALDADGVIEPAALLLVARPIIEEPDLVIATGGFVRVANGCQVKDGHIVAEGLPTNALAMLQVVEYFRAFLVGRIAWSAMQSLLIISGAFGLFRRSLVEEVGGYSTETVCEDMELVLRLHRHLREQKQCYRVQFVAEPVCWTEAPEDLRTLSRQRRRWQRGLGESLWRHRRMLGNPRYGVIGVVAMPFFFVFEFVGPALETLGLISAVVSYAAGNLSKAFMVAFLVVSLLLGIVLSVAALAIEQQAFRRRRPGRELLRLLSFAAIENFGYRQLVSLWRALAFVDLLRRRKAWGVQRRRGMGGDRPSASRAG